MIKRISLIVVHLILSGLVSFAAVDEAPAGADVSKPVPPPSATNLWFDVGETIQYDIYWGVIHVGTSMVSTEWVRHTDGRTLLRIRLDTHSNRVVEKIYPVEDLQETLIDPDTFLPVFNYIKSRQGRRSKHEEVYFDHANRKAYWESFTKGKKKVVDIEADTRDLISMMYYIRSQPVEIGKQTDLRVYTEEKIYDLYIKTPRKEDVDLAKYGDVSSVLYEPEAAFEGLFVRKGKMYMWVSDDARKVCVKITATIPVANIRLILSDVTGPGDDFWVNPELLNKSEATARPKHRRR